MASYTAVDLSKLQAPDLIDALDYESVFAKAMAQLIELVPEFTALVESDPVYKIVQLFCARELALRQTVNDKARQCMLAYANGTNLDHIGALFGVSRLTLDPGDAENGIAATLEPDADMRRRIQLAPEGFSVAGPEGAYIFHALSAHADVLDASATSPTPGDVIVTILSRQGDGTAGAGVIDAVASALRDDDVRPLTDAVTVQSAEIVPFAIRARVYTFAGPDSAVVMSEARRRLDAYLAESHRIGRDVPESAIKATLFADGVQRVELDSPAADVVISRTQAPYCNLVEVQHAGIDE
ncbi:baseplate assembly protein [Xanthomonas translucens]|uniref:baseplate assembly protein n=1 Tax=Xanthomonas campestris pv. translucens TaxID=343 RepID=UPI0021B789B4|nr:baseplate J/gp47 family protein [Xanthomonas translucens]MCT8273355.1 baseplate J/gp47 family protein [Xanthomonas translucens pv. translucens]MCT8277501.1 baseplate J/gp47 family protein [Xanthomonas translucens pv. translucens]MCT8306306.1 baseplate J/gp47 family protein [Xanthomonas translucens pv. translucens]WNJ27812.1 baseplate J/gp47 family protein [Xanthomonas translucens pv. translucens]